MLGVVVLHFGREAEPLLKECVRSLERNTVEPFRLRVLVNGGPTPNLDIGESLLVAERQPSLAAAYNLACEGLDCDKIAFVHNDCFVPPAWDVEPARLVDNGAVAFPHVSDDPKSPVPPPDPRWPPSCCWMLSAELFRKLGGFDESFLFCHFEDWDIWMRAIKAGAVLRRAENTTVFHARGFTRALQAEAANPALIANQRIYEAKHGKTGPCVLGENNAKHES